jgi:putative nucleotidyltransferase with HDIG domain
MNRRLNLMVFIKVVLIAVGLLTLLQNWRLADFTQPWLLIFIVAIASIRLAEVELPQGDKVTLDASLVIAAILLFDLPTALIMAVGGVIAATVPRPHPEGLGNPLFAIGQRTVAVVVAGWWTGGRYVTASDPDKVLNLLSWDLLGAAALCATFFLLEMSLDQLSLSQRRGSPFTPALLGSFRLIGPIYFSLASIGLLMSMMYSSMGMWGVFLFGLPLIVIHYSFQLYLDIKNTYRHTISALTRAIQVEDLDQRSHSERVADLAVDIGRELGFHGEKLEELGYAALLHDIGKLGLDIDSFDALLDQRRNTDTPPHAEIGAEILEQVEFLKRFAQIVRQHHLAFVNRRNVDLEHPIEARIIALANYFDQLTQTPLAQSRLSPNQAVARLKREADRFDPKVFRALISVLKHQQRLIVTSG